MLLPAGNAFREGARETQAVVADHCKVVVPDATLLFHYSALGFNSHRIHLDRDYARTVEGFPDLVVNGGLTTLLLTEFARRELGLTPRRLSVKYTAPLFAGRTMTLAASRTDDRWQLRAFDDTGTPAAVAEMEVV
jgi:3-methylfumaryl-CoA hydratase